MSTSSLVRFSLIVALILGATKFAHAGFFLTGATGFTGYSVFGTGLDPDLADATVSFAVYVNTDGDWSDDSAFSAFSVPGDYFEGLNGGGVDTGSAFVYLYQLVNDDPVPPPGIDDDIDSLFVRFAGNPIGLVTGGGFILDSTFSDGTNLSGSNTGLGTDGAAIDTPGDNAPSSNYGSDPILVKVLGGSSTTDSVQFGPSSGPKTFVEFGFDESGGVISPGGRSNILYITSNYAPIWFPGRANDDGITSGDIPVPNPEPRSLAMTLGALACGLAAVVIANKRKAV
jgi:hypothetical protein